MPERIDILTLAQSAEIPGAIRSLPGGRNAGDLMVRGVRADVPGVTARDGADYEIIARGGTSPPEGIFRTALFAAIHNPTPERIAAFEADLIAMPRHIATIRGWALGRVTRAWGRFPWTHVWEQTYEALEGLTGTYIHHPHHWGHVDRWFDAEHPDWLVDPGVCHAFGEASPLPQV